MSSDPSQANVSYCGPPPYSSQIFSLSANLTVVDHDSDPNESMTPTNTFPTATFSTRPTGDIVQISGVRSLRETATTICTLMVITVALALVT